MNSLIFSFILLTVFTSSTLALKCYTCTSTSEDIDEQCVNDPASMTIATAITDCDKKYCYSVRVEYVDPKGKVDSMVRTCLDDPPFKNQVVEDSTFRTYYKVCQEELCNGGTGTDLSTQLSSNENGKLTTLFVRGIGSASTVIGSIGLLLIAQLYVFVI